MVQPLYMEAAVQADGTAIMYIAQANGTTTPHRGSRWYSCYSWAEPDLRAPPNYKLLYIEAAAQADGTAAIHRGSSTSR